MSDCVLGNKGQDDGNQGNGYEIEHGKTDAGKLGIGTIPVNLQFPLFSCGWSWDM